MPPTGWHGVACYVVVNSPWVIKRSSTLLFISRGTRFSSYPRLKKPHIYGLPSQIQKQIHFARALPLSSQPWLGQRFVQFRHSRTCFFTILFLPILLCSLDVMGAP
ncbi:hypothetical protein EV361DRAFT_834426 [Lentinula raphanica]|nr:hypothetical protein EV361DRAFT_834426 [Lentinula raphanica]